MTATAIRPRSTMRTTFIASSGRGLEATALGVGTNYFTLRESLQRAPSRSGRAGGHPGSPASANHPGSASFCTIHAKVAGVKSITRALRGAGVAGGRLPIPFGVYNRARISRRLHHAQKTLSAHLRRSQA